MSDPIRLFVLGLGYSGTALARAMKGHAASIAGTVRSTERAATLAAEGIAAIVFTGDSPNGAVTKALDGVTHIVASIPPGETGDPALVHHRADIVAAPALTWIGYLSTVGVYGRYGGAWVSERTTPHPAHGRSTVRLAAERAWQGVAAERGVPTAVFRIAGIYGPGRNAFVSLAEGKAHRVVKPGQVFNRIHVDDIAGGVLAALAAGAAGIFNLADDEPAPAEDVVAYAANLMGVAPPPAIPFEEADLSPMARSFYEGNKRVLNRRLKDTLGVRLHYPTYREGLAALWRRDDWRGPGG
jgi:nucleoside-diphosphate-sugar epimerase